MQNPHERDIDTPMQETGMIPFDSLENASLDPVEPTPPSYKKEPLFNKKVMLVWAIGAAAVWFAVTFILPIAFESAKSAIVQQIKEAEGTGSNVIIERNGQRITITTKPSTPAPATAATPPAAGATAAPPIPVEPPKPVKPAEGSKKTEPSRK
jgi:hypothetical protein